MSKNKTTKTYTHKAKQDKITMVVRTRVNGKPRFKIGVWLIRLGVWIARVHVQVWIEEERRK